MKIKPEEYQAVDEMCVAYRGKKSPIRQYMPAKPAKWCMKLWGRAGASGILFDFKVYEGASSNSEYSGVGMSGAVVLRMTSTLPENVPFQIIADTFFTSMPLIQKLSQRGFLFTGTFRANRIPVKMIEEK